eukprot:7898964-Pyramimonas_sp.AAC.1
MVGPLPTVSGALYLLTGLVLVMLFGGSRVLPAWSVWLTPMGLLWLSLEPLSGAPTLRPLRALNSVRSRGPMFWLRIPLIVMFIQIALMLFGSLVVRSLSNCPAKG